MTRARACSAAMADAMARLEADPRDHEAYVTLARCSARAGDAKSAQEAFRIAIRILLEAPGCVGREMEWADRQRAAWELQEEGEKLLEEATWREKDAMEALRRKHDQQKEHDPPGSSPHSMAHQTRSSTATRSTNLNDGVERNRSKDPASGYIKGAGKQTPSWHRPSHSPRDPHHHKQHFTYKHQENDKPRDYEASRRTNNYQENDVDVMMEHLNHYQLLGVEETADFNTIRKAYLKKVVTAHPDKGGSALLFARMQEAYSTLGDYTARQAYDRRIQRDLSCTTPRRGTFSGPGNPEVPQEHADLSEDAYNEMLRHKSEHFLGRARSLQHEGRFEQAYEIATEAIRLAIACKKENLHEFLLARALLNQDLGKYDHAIADAEEALSMKKNCANCLWLLGQLHSQEGQWEEAEEVLTRLSCVCQDSSILAESNILLEEVLRQSSDLRCPFA